MSVPRDRTGRFVNWAGTVRSHPTAWHEPTSDDQLATIVRTAASAGKRVRAVGTGHSWSAVAAPDQVAVSLARLTGVIAIDRSRARVTVRGGTSIAALIAELARAGYTLPIRGSITAQSIAGAIATGTHGSSLVHGNLSSLVVGLELIDGRGERVVLGGDDARLDGARVHLGALGVITSVTLPIVPAFQLAETVEAIPVAHVPDAIGAIAASAEYVKVWWLPHTRDALIYRYTRTDEPDTVRPSVATRRWLDERVVHGALLPALSVLMRRRPDVIPLINRTFERTLRRARTVGRSELMLGTPMPVNHRESEAAVPMTRAGDAFARLVELIERDAMRVNFIVEARFVRGDRGWLSPAFGADTCQLGAYIGHVPDADRYIRAFWRALDPLDARPHWGKELDPDPGADGAIAARYPLADRFRALRDELDPNRVFDSAFLTRALGPRS